MRDLMGGRSYWDKWIEFSIGHIQKKWQLLELQSKNPLYDPQFAFDLSKQENEVQMLRYSRGDAVGDLSQYFPGLLEAWELSNKLAEDVCREHNLKTCRDWTFALADLNHYNWCFWLVGLALSLEIPDDQWGRLLALIGGEGEDELLDRVIASRQSGRRIGTGTLHGKPYARLLKAIDTPCDQQAALLREFVDHWYPELARTGKQRLWWYDYGDPVKHPLEMGSYFGRWCIEAAAVAKAFNIDDSLCLDHPNYPGDLLQDGRSPRYPDPEPIPEPSAPPVSMSPPRRSWLARLLGKH